MASPTYRFGDFRLDPANRKLWRGDEELSLPPKPFNCLVYLVEHRDRAVEHDELIHAVWGDICLSDRVLAQNISVIRHALNDNGEEQEYIETLRGFGYRWAAPVETDEPAAESSTTTPNATEVPDAGTRSRDRPIPLWMPLVVLTVGVLVAGALHLRQDAEPRPPDAPPAPRAEGEIALLLPVTVDADSEHAWARLGLMDLIATRLREAGQAMVPSDTVIALLRGDSSEPDPAELSRLTETTGAHLVLAAHARTTGTRWTISLHSLLGAEPPLTTVGEAYDVLEAARSAADSLALTLGRSPAPEQDGEATLRRLVYQIRAAGMAQQTGLARSLIEDADPRLREHPRIRFEWGWIQLYSHNLDAAQATFEALLEESSGEQDPELRALLLNGLGAVHGARYDQDAATPLLEEAARLLSGRDTLPELGSIWMNLGNMALLRGDFEAARGYMAQARRVYEGVGDVQRLARLESNVGILAARRERYAEALRHFESAAERYAAVQDVGGELLARSHVMHAHWWLLDPQAASQAEPRILELLAQTNNPEIAVTVNLNRALFLHATGRCEAEKALRSGVLAATEGRDDLHVYRMATLLQVANHAVHDGDAAQAAKVASKVFEELPSDIVEARGRAGLTLVGAHLALGDVRAAARASQALTEWARHAHADAASAKIYAALAEAELAAAEGRREAAETAFERALALADGAQVPLHLLQVAQSYVPWLLAKDPHRSPDPGRALHVADRVAEYADRYYEAALLQLRVYDSLGPPSVWRTALARATSLAGERHIPEELSLAPQTQHVIETESPASARL